ncbi:MAG: hypothetical protein ACOYMG_27395 [Candidatus Methylumidiphilus sp.]
MSTSSDKQKRNNISGQAPYALRSTKRSGKPGLILLRGLFWIALIIGVLVLLVMNYEIVWSVLIETVFPALQTVFEVAEAGLDSFFLLVGVGASFAPIATVYTGVVLALGILYFVARKAITTYQKIQSKKREVSQTYANAWNEWYGSLQEKTNHLKSTAFDRLLAWWQSLDVYNKVFAVIFLVLIGIPVFLLISLILGNLVASLI